MFCQNLSEKLVCRYMTGWFICMQYEARQAMTVQLDSPSTVKDHSVRPLWQSQQNGLLKFHNDYSQTSSVSWPGSSLPDNLEVLMAST